MDAHAQSQEHAAGIARAALSKRISIGAAESLTAGAIASALGKAEDAATWFRGAVVAYASQVKFEVLGVPEGPVVTASCAEQMARGARELLGSDWAVAVTGAGGPDPEEGQPPGSVYLAVAGPDHVEVRHQRFHGDPPEVVAETVTLALGMLLVAIQK